MITMRRQVVFEPDPGLLGDNGYRWLVVTVGRELRRPDATVLPGTEYSVERVPLGGARESCPVDAATFRDLLALAGASLP